MFKHVLSIFVVFLITFVIGATGLFSIQKVGEEVSERFETPHPYEGKKGLVWEKVFHYPRAGYIAVHFASFDLDAGTSVNVSLTPGFASTVYTEYWKIFIDYNNDGNTDIIWRNYGPGDGRTAVWYMNGATKTGHAYFTKVGTLSWDIENN